MKTMLMAAAATAVLAAATPAGAVVYDWRFHGHVTASNVYLGDVGAPGADLTGKHIAFTLHIDEATTTAADTVPGGSYSFGVLSARVGLNGRVFDIGVHPNSNIQAGDFTDGGVSTEFLQVQAVSEIATFFGPEYRGLGFAGGLAGADVVAGDGDWRTLTQEEVMALLPVGVFTIYRGGSDEIQFVIDSAAFTPEPQAWGLMIGGFGLAGSALRRRRPKLT